MIQSYSDFYRFIADYPTSFDYIESVTSKGKPHFVYRESFQHSTYLSVCHYGSIGNIDIFELTYNISCAFDFQKLKLYIQHFMKFLKQYYTNRSKSFVLFKRAETRKHNEKNDMIYISLKSEYKQLGAVELKMLLGNLSNIEYCFHYLQDNSTQMMNQTILTLNDIQMLTERKIIRSLIQTHYFNNSETEYFLYFYFMYGLHRLNLTFKISMPIELEMRFAFGEGFAPYSFYFREHLHLEDAIKELIEKNKLIFLFK